MKYVLSFSGGKDSTIALKLIVENNLPLDEVICAILPYEYEDVIEHIYTIKEWLLRKTGINMKLLVDPNAEEKVIKFMGEKTKRGKHKGTIRAFPLAYKGFCWISRDFKIVPLQKWAKEYSKRTGEEVHLYKGFATDEKNRSRKGKILMYLDNKARYIYNNKESYPLVDFGYSEEMCREELKNFFSCKSHFEFNRTGCWLCMKATIETRIKGILRDPINRMAIIENFTNISQREIYPDITLNEIKQRVSSETN